MKQFLLCLLLCLSLCLSAMTEQELYQELERLDNEGSYAQACELTRQYILEHGDSSDLMFLMASFQVREERPDEAFQSLGRAVDLRMLDIEWIKDYGVFASLKDDPRWERLDLRAKAVTDSLTATLPLERTKEAAIALPEPLLKGVISVEEALQQRRSVRYYKEEPLSLQEVSQILWAAYGITVPLDAEQLRGGLKTAPSAGALYPLELYLGAWNVTGLEPGYYYYEPKGHQLYPVRLGLLNEELAIAAYYQDWAYEAPASLIYSAVFSRCTDKYKQRGRERYVCMDLGHSAENVYLQAEALGLGTVALGAFNDLKLRLSVQMTREEEPLYIMPFGKKADPEGEE